MTLDQIAIHCCDKLGRQDDQFLEQARGFVRVRYQMVWESALWKESLGVVYALADTQDVIIPGGIQSVVAVRYSGREITPSDLGTIFQVNAAALDQEGDPRQFAHLPPSAVSASPGGSALILKSNFSGDNRQHVVLRGTLAGVEQEERLTLNGTSDVQTAKLWDEVVQLSKDQTAGTVTVSRADNAAVILTLWPEENQRRFRRIRLLESPKDKTKSLAVLGKRTFRQLNDGLDVPMLEGIDNALIAYTTGDLLEVMRQFGKAAAKVSEGGEMVKEMRNMEKNDSASVSRIVPDMSGGSYGYGGDWNADFCK